MQQAAVKVFCIIAVRNEERYLPGFLRHIRDHVDGIVAIDDGSTDASAALLSDEPRVLSLLREDRPGAPHANETANRHRLLLEAARLGADWVLCADADERYDEAFLRRVRAEAEKGDRAGRPVREVRLVNLWNAGDRYRADGRCGPRWAPRMFKLPPIISPRAPRMHQPWFPPELDTAPRGYVNAYLYHLRMIDRADREARFAKFRAIDPDNRHQTIGYSHLVDESGLVLKPVLPWRRYPGMEDVTAAAKFDAAFHLPQNRRRPRLLGLDFAAIVGAWRQRET